MSKASPTIEEIDQARRAVGKALDVLDGLPTLAAESVDQVQTARDALDAVADDLKLLKGTEDLTVAEHAERLYPSQ